MVVLVTVMGVQVFFRYVLNDSLIWAEEVCRYLLILMTFLLLGPAFERGEMVNLRLLMDIVPDRVRLAITVPIYLVMITFLLVLAYYGYQFATLNSRFSMPAIDFIGTALLGREVNLALSMYWLYMTIPAGCLILAGHLVLAVLRMIGAARQPRAPEAAGNRGPLGAGDGIG